MEDERGRAEVSVAAGEWKHSVTLHGISNTFCLWYERVRYIKYAAPGYVRYAMSCDRARTIDFSFPMITSKCTGMFCINKRVDKGRGGWSQRRRQPSAIHHAMTSHDVLVISKAMPGERVYPCCFQYHLWCFRCFDVMILGFRCFISVFWIKYAVLYGFEVFLKLPLRICT